MRIALDARWIFEQLSGIGLYTQELITHLAEEDSQNRYILLFNDDALRERSAAVTRFNWAANFDYFMLSNGPFSPWNQVELPMILRKLRIDVYHSMNYMIPFMAFPKGRAGRTRCVVTIHDLIPLLHPEYTPKAKKTRFYPLFKAVMRETAERTDVLIVPSESSRRDMAATFPHVTTLLEHTRVIPEGVGRRFRLSSESTEREERILYVGRFDAYKNVPTLIDAYAQILKERPSTHLTLIGHEDPRYPEARQRARELGLEDRIEWRGYVSDEELIQAYQKASVFVLPSRYEGFGLPVLEAMACGCPVVCGRHSSLPEVAGEAAVYADIDSADAVAQAVLNLLNDPRLAEEKSTGCLKSARSFSWRRTAEQTVEAYNRAMRMSYG